MYRKTLMLLASATLLSAQQTLTFAPTSLSFTSIGGVSPALQQVSIALQPGAPVQQVIVGGSPEVSGQTWLNPVFVPGTPGQLGPGARIDVRMNPAGLPNGTSRGTIGVTLILTNASLTSGVIPVTLMVSGVAGGGGPGPTLLVSPAQLSFVSPVNGLPAEQQFGISTSVTARLPFTLAPSSPWLVLLASAGTTPDIVRVRVNTNGLTPGTYSGSIVLNANGAAVPTVSIPVSLTISAPPPTVSPAALTFTMLEGGPVPAPQTLTINSSVPLPYDVSAFQPWLELSPVRGNAPGSVSVRIIPLNYSAGTYQDNIRVGFATTAINIPVTYRVDRNLRDLRFSSPDAVFEYQKGGPLPAPQTIAFTALDGQPVPYTISSDSAWLTVTAPANRTTPGPITLALAPEVVAGLPARTYSGAVTVNTPNASRPQSVLPVAVRISDRPVLMSSGVPFRFSASPLGGDSPPPQTRQILASSGALNLTASVMSERFPGAFSVSLDQSVTPATLTVRVTPPPGLGPGLYIETVTLRSPVSTLEIPIFLNVSLAPRLVPSLTEMNFTSANRYASQTLRVTSTASNFLYTAAALAQGPVANWLSLGSQSAVTPGFLSVAVNPGSLPEGTYYGSITLLALGADNPVTAVPVTLTIPPSDTALRAAPTNLSFTQPQGGPPPEASRVDITSVQAVPFRATTSISSPAGADWLVVSPQGTMTNSWLEVALAPSAAALPLGNYQALINVSGPNSPNTTPIEVRLSVVTGPPPVPTISGVGNAATFAPPPLSPGMLVTITGRNLGPTPGVEGALANGRFTTSVAGVQVFFDNLPAPILFASGSQINAIVPYAVAFRASTQIVVQSGALRSSAFLSPLSDTAPGIFTVDGRRAAALNQDGSVNSPQNPASPGSVLVLFLTGEGLTTPPAADGELIPANNLRQPRGRVRVRLNDAELPASEVFYAGSAPGLVSGLMQINFRLPPGSPTNAATTVEISVGDVYSPPGTTVSVR
ncbi:MAG: hypothetical protein K2X03_29400 [Bryobacteraceae bacterium]|nr:hypothetical protein [Bryobacteraceae bacterium]